MSDFLSLLNDKQREAVTTTTGPLLVIAGAGSGKTRALTHRIAYLMAEKKISPWNILAVTFTNKAAQEMKERILKLTRDSCDDGGDMNGGGDMGTHGGAVFGRDIVSEFRGGRSGERDVPTIGTFHSLCVRILRKHAHVIDYETAFTIYDTTDQEILMKRLMEERKMDPKKMNPRAILSGISGAKNQLISPKEYLRYANTHFTEKVAELYLPYQEALRKNSAMDFDDLIMKTVEIFRHDTGVLNEYQERFSFISVDEYQDTNHAQYVLVKLLASKHQNLCAIGDEDQSIYSWRGATIRNILDFEKDYPNAKIIKLEQNYRSTQEILDAAHSVICLNSQRKEKRLWTDRIGGEKIHILMARSERAEGEMVAEEILRILRSHERPDYRDFVVLYRTNAQSRVLEEIFLRYGIPYKIIGGIKFYERKEIKDVLAYLRVIQNPRDSVSLLRILNVPARNIGLKTLEALQRFAAGRSGDGSDGFGTGFGGRGAGGPGGSAGGISLFEAMEEVASFLSSARSDQEPARPGPHSSARSLRLHDAVTDSQIEHLSDTKIQSIEKFAVLIRKLQQINSNETAAGLMKYVLEETGYRAFLDDGSSEGEERLENVRELISVAKKYDSLEPAMSLRVFLEEVSLISDADQVNESANSITLMTVHSAKGLEFSNVFVVGLEEGIFPHGRNVLERDQLEEERRLMYVAMTRAKERLYLLFAQERLLYGEYRHNAPSQFLGALPEEIVERNYQAFDSEIVVRRERSMRNFGGKFAENLESSGGDFTGVGRAGHRKREVFSKLISEMAKPVPMENVESPYVDGDRVIHRDYGSGVVLNSVGGVVTVVFENPSVGVKKMAVSIAPMKKV